MLLKYLALLLLLAPLTLGAYQIVQVSNLKTGGQVRNQAETSRSLFWAPTDTLRALSHRDYCNPYSRTLFTPTVQVLDVQISRKTAILKSTATKPNFRGSMHCDCQFDADIRFFA